MVLLMCMSNLLQWLVFYILLYTSVKASTHFVMLVGCCHRVLFCKCVLIWSVYMSIFCCVYLINLRLWYEGTPKYLGESATGSKFRLWKNDRALAWLKKTVGRDAGRGAGESQQFPVHAQCFSHLNGEQTTLTSFSDSLLCASGDRV